MRLLKRAADEAKKNVVLITSEAGLLPLAGAAGVHVAKTLDSAPSIPSAPDSDDKEETVNEESAEVRDTEITAATAGAIAVGALAGLPPKDEVETLELDDEEEAVTGTDDGTGHVDLKAPVVKKDSKLKVPNFNKFRVSLFVIGALLVLLIGGFIYANNVLPKAVITINTDAVAVNTSINTTLSSTATTLDLTTSTVPAKVVSTPKTFTQTATATGKKNIGPKATGKVTLSLKDCSQPQVTIPAGTGVSTGSLTFTTQQSATLTRVMAGTTCINSSNLSYSTATVDVIAQSGGLKYNIAVTTYTVAGFSTLVSASGTAMSGGDDKIQTVLSQSDIDSATAKIVTDNPIVKQDLATQLTKAGFTPILSTYVASAPVVTASANVGDVVDSVTVTNVITYTMFGVKDSDLKALVDNNIKSQIDTVKQSILTEGLSTGTFTLQTSTATTAQVTIATTATVGPQLNAATIAKQAAGKKIGDVKSLLQGNPDVTSIDIKLSPFWVTSVPKNYKKVTVIISKPSKVTPTTNSNAATNP